MIRLLFLSGFIFFQISLISQVEFAPPGAEWCYTYYGGFGPGEGYMKMKYVADTTIQSKAVKILKVVDVNQAFDTINYTMLVHQAMDSVFMYRTFNQEFNYLFRNNVYAGEIVIYAGGGQMYVESLDTFHFGIEQLIQHNITGIGNGVPGDRKSYDRAGPEPGFFDIWIAAGNDGFNYQLKWYKDLEIPHFQVSEGACENLFTSINSQSEKEQTSVFPNPTGDFLKIKTLSNNLNRISYEIYDPSGGLISFERELKGNIIDVKDLPLGMYFIVFEVNGVFQQSRFVKY